MTKQEQIREGLEQLLGSLYCGMDSWIHAENAPKILKYLDSQGVVIKAERPFPVMFGTVDSYCQGIREMRESGWAFTEPLI